MRNHRDVILKSQDGEYWATGVESNDPPVRANYGGDNEAQAVGLYVAREGVPNVEALGRLVLEHAEELGVRILRA